MNRQTFRLAPVLALGLLIASGTAGHAAYNKTRKIMMEDFPPPVVRTVNAYMNGSQIVETKATTMGSHSFYTATLRKRDGSEIDLVVKPDGEVQSFRHRKWFETTGRWD